MPSLLKVLVPCTIGLSGAGFASTNAFIKTNQLVKVAEDDEAGWSEKLKILVTKVKPENEELKKEIEGSNVGHLTLKEPKGDFENPENAKKSLQAWCKNNTNENKEDFKELCKHEQKRGWLFG